MATIKNGKKALTSSMVNIEMCIELDDDLLAQLCTEEGRTSHLKTTKTNVVSLISAMNAATSKMVTHNPLTKLFCEIN